MFRLPAGVEVTISGVDFMSAVISMQAARVMRVLQLACAPLCYSCNVSFRHLDSSHCSQVQCTLMT